RLAIGVRRHAARSALEQGKADGALQVLQQLGRGWLGHAERGRRLAQALLLSERDQKQELAALEPLQDGQAIAIIASRGGSGFQGSLPVISKQISPYQVLALFRNTGIL